MVCKEEVVTWFKCLPSAERIDLICGLLQSCLPLEKRFVGSYIEDLCRSQYNSLREDEIAANDPHELHKMRELNMYRVLDCYNLSRIISYLSLLYSSNSICSHIIFELVRKVEDSLYHVIRTHSMQRSQYRLETDFVNDICLLMTMAANHPAFSFDQKMRLQESLIKVMSFFKGMRQQPEQYPEKESRDQVSVLEKKPAAEMEDPVMNRSLPVSVPQINSSTLNHPRPAQQGIVSSPLLSPLTSPSSSPQVSPSTSQYTGGSSRSNSPQVPKDVTAWLKSIRLHKYTKQLKSYSFIQLSNLTDEQLGEYGLTQGAKKKIRKEIEYLKHKIPGLMCNGLVSTGSDLSDAQSASPATSPQLEWHTPPQCPTFLTQPQQYPHNPHGTAELLSSCSETSSPATSPRPVTLIRRYESSITSSEDLLEKESFETDSRSSFDDSLISNKSPNPSASCNPGMSPLSGLTSIADNVHQLQAPSRELHNLKLDNLPEDLPQQPPPPQFINQNTFIPISNTPRHLDIISVRPLRPQIDNNIRPHPGVPQSQIMSPSNVICYQPRVPLIAQSAAHIAAQCVPFQMPAPPSPATSHIASVNNNDSPKLSPLPGLSVENDNVDNEQKESVGSELAVSSVVLTSVTTSIISNSNIEYRGPGVPFALPRAPSIGQTRPSSLGIHHGPPPMTISSSLVSASVTTPGAELKTINTPAQNRSIIVNPSFQTQQGPQHINGVVSASNYQSPQLTPASTPTPVPSPSPRPRGTPTPTTVPTPVSCHVNPCPNCHPSFPFALPPFWTQGAPLVMSPGYLPPPGTGNGYVRTPLSFSGGAMPHPAAAMPGLHNQPAFTIPPNGVQRDFIPPTSFAANPLIINNHMQPYMIRYPHPAGLQPGVIHTSYKTAKSNVSCSNCGGNGHRAAECREQTMEEISNSGSASYHLHYRPPPSPTKSETD